MKRGTPRHPKTYALAESLSIPLPHAVGILEMLWHHAAQYTPCGDIGSLPNGAIAEAVCWTKKPADLIAALVENGWVDVCPVSRYLIHDWEEHCEQSVRKWMERNGKSFLTISDQCAENVQTTAGQHPPSRVAVAVARAKAVLNKTNSESSLLTSEQSAWFGEFWAAYWRRIGRGAAEKSFAVMVTTSEQFERVMQAVEMQTPAMSQRDSDKRPYPATWLNQKRWLDDADTLTHSNGRMSNADRIDEAFKAI